MIRLWMKEVGLAVTATADNDIAQQLSPAGDTLHSPLAMKRFYESARSDTTPFRRTVEYVEVLSRLSSSFEVVGTLKSGVLVFERGGRSSGVCNDIDINGMRRGQSILRLTQRVYRRIDPLRSLLEVFSRSSTTFQVSFTLSGRLIAKEGYNSNQDVISFALKFAVHHNGITILLVEFSNAFHPQRRSYGRGGQQRSSLQQQHHRTPPPSGRRSTESRRVITLLIVCCPSQRCSHPPLHFFQPLSHLGAEPQRFRGNSASGDIAAIKATAQMRGFAQLLSSAKFTQAFTARLKGLEKFHMPFTSPFHRQAGSCPAAATPAGGIVARERLLDDRRLHNVRGLQMSLEVCMFAIKVWRDSSTHLEASFTDRRPLTDVQSQQLHPAISSQDEHGSKGAFYAVIEDADNSLKVLTITSKIWRDSSSLLQAPSTDRTSFNRHPTQPHYLAISIATAQPLDNSHWRLDEGLDKSLSLSTIIPKTSGDIVAGGGSHHNKRSGKVEPIETSLEHLKSDMKPYTFANDIVDSEHRSDNCLTGAVQTVRLP
ncbi:hypothetical protein M409DRAFT_61334 [Zasmidium cellare ATCC 36951]|uniref:Uncharacterized protein n=1 Tax=Zasmidium cellare ATCC 36951 TaxID=1080233 RepID=A0A6A6BZ74_ZASCE|nr:uncharacterized protein M409DRAFT_61334 [Zasmidium cellare ATCC 36951]KAF2158829.1 hypothetical protein M409DRAFT_61334 [Zasmidium cellare ATCC 36951]